MKKEQYNNTVKLVNRYKSFLEKFEINYDILPDLHH